MGAGHRGERGGDWGSGASSKQALQLAGQGIVGLMAASEWVAQLLGMGVGTAGAHGEGVGRTSGGAVVGVLPHTLDPSQSRRERDSWLVNYWMGLGGSAGA